MVLDQQLQTISLDSNYHGVGGRVEAEIEAKTFSNYFVWLFCEEWAIQWGMFDSNQICLL